MIQKLLHKADAARNSKTVRAALIFTLVLWLYEFAALGYDADRHDLLVLIGQGRLLVAVRSVMLTGFSLVLTVALFAFALRAPVVAKIICFMMFGFALSAEYVHHDIFDRFSTFSAAAVGMTAGNWIFAAKALAMYFNALCLPPIIAFLIVLITHRSSQLRPRPLLLLTASITAFAAFTAYFSSNRYATVSPWAFVRTAVGYPVISLAGRAGTQAFGAAPRRRATVDFVATNKPSNNIVLIVDESVRGDHLQINGYAANPVPVLSRLSMSQNMANYGIASAGSTCSNAANNLLLTGLNDLPDRNLKIYEMPTIFQYARAMGYRTYEFDGQVSTVWNGTVADLKFIQNRQTPLHLASSAERLYEIDGEIARRVKRVVSASVGNFIWINKRGVHKPYSDNFPKANTSIRDAWYIAYDRRISTRQLIADYDAAIRFNLNLFFEQLLENDSPSRNTIYIYTSDHGQSLREGGAQVSHCSTSRPEAMVPLLILGSQIKNRGFDTGYRASHDNVFPTLLDLMKVPREVRKYRYAASLTEARASDSSRRYYFDADLTGEDGGKRHPFDP